MSFSFKSFKYKIVGKSRFVACVLDSNPLAQKEEIEVADLRGYNMIMLSPLTSPSWVATMTKMFNSAGFSPRAFMYVDDVRSLFMNLQRADQVVLTDYNVLDELLSSNMVTLPIKNTVSGSLLIWHKDNENDAIRDFIVCAEDFFKNNNSLEKER